MASPNLRETRLWVFGDRSFSLETAKDTWLTSDSGAMQSLPAQMLADSAVWQGDAMPCFQNRADLGS